MTLLVAARNMPPFPLLQVRRILLRFVCIFLNFAGILYMRAKKCITNFLFVKSVAVFADPFDEIFDEHVLLKAVHQEPHVGVAI